MAEAQQAARLEVTVTTRATHSMLGDVTLIATPEKGAARTLRSDEKGRAVFDSLVPGVWRLKAQHIGFQPGEVGIRVGDGDNTVAILLEQNAPPMIDTVRIVGGRRVTSRLDDFETRRILKLTTATISRAEIEKRNPFALSQMLTNLPSIRIADSAGVKVAISTRGMKKGYFTDNTGRPREGLVNCMLQVMVDNVLMPYGFDLDQISPQEVHGIELFAGAARMPPNLSSIRTDSWCGLLVIWTRDR
jgi:hypothetical protein